MSANTGRRRLLNLVLPLGLFAVMMVVGIVAVQGSGYKSVCELKGVSVAQDVIVQGNVSKLPRGYLVVIVQGENGEAKFEALNAKPDYAVVERVSGKFGRYDTDNSYALFVLGAECKGFHVIALYSATEFHRVYGTGSHIVMSERVVVQGHYDPTLHAKVYVNGVKVYEGPVLIVTKILEGCHEAYTQPMVS